MHRRIVVPLNDSLRSERALPVAAAFARRMRASLALVTVIERPLRNHATIDTYHEWLMCPYRDIDAESIAVTGSVSTGILSICEPGDVMCMGVDRTSAVGELLLTSVFFDLVRKFHGPMIAVGPHASLPTSATKMLIGLDGEAAAERELDHLLRMATSARLEPFLVQAVAAQKNHAFNPDDVPDSAYLNRLTHRRSELAHVGWDVLHGPADQAIATAATSEDVAAVAVATDAAHAVSHLFTPSLANDLIGLSPRPVIIVNATLPVCVTRRPIRRCVPASASTQPSWAYTPPPTDDSQTTAVSV
jgi:nucleotide-binding universal stress UspA family protein